LWSGHDRDFVFREVILSAFEIGAVWESPKQGNKQGLLVKNRQKKAGILRTRAARSLLLRV
jgi:hypothetical protein